MKKLIPDIPRKKKDTPELETVEETVKPPPLTIYSVDVTKPEEDSFLTTWEFDSAPMILRNLKNVQSQIQDILAFTPRLGYLHCFHPKDIQLLLEATTKY